MLAWNQGDEGCDSYYSHGIVDALEAYKVLKRGVCSATLKEGNILGGYPQYTSPAPTNTLTTTNSPTANPGKSHLPTMLDAPIGNPSGFPSVHQPHHIRQWTPLGGPSSPDTRSPPEAGPPLTKAAPRVSLGSRCGPAIWILPSVNVSKRDQRPPQQGLPQSLPRSLPRQWFPQRWFPRSLPPGLIQILP